MVLPLSITTADENTNHTNEISTQDLLDLADWTMVLPSSRIRLSFKDDDEEEEEEDNDDDDNDDVDYPHNKRKRSLVSQLPLEPLRQLPRCATTTTGTTTTTTTTITITEPQCLIRLKILVKGINFRF